MSINDQILKNDLNLEPKEVKSEIFFSSIEDNDIASEPNNEIIQKTKKDKVIHQVLSKEVANPIFLSVSESANLGGVTSKTIRRAIQDKKIRYKIVKNRYLIDLASVITYLMSNKKLLNKMKQYGIGQYIDKWRD